MEKFLHTENTQENSVETITVNPGESVPLHSHPDREEEYTGLSGDGSVIVDGIEYPFSKGSRILVPKGSKHAVKNTGDNPLVFFAINIPAFKPGDTTFWDEASANN